MQREKIISNYEGFDEDKRAFGTKSEQIEFIYTKKLLDQYIDASKSVVELGCGTGYYGMYLSDKCKTYHGVDLTPKHIEQFQDKIGRYNLRNLSAEVGDATNLLTISNSTYDVVLVLGPMYHLPKEERTKVIAESTRICKSGGIVMFAYINKIGAYLRGCIDTTLKDRYPSKRVNELVLNRGVDDVMPDVFFFTMPEEMEADAKVAGLSVLRSAGVDFTFNASDINTMDDEKYTAWTEIMDTMFQSESCTGVSNHAVLVCRK